MIYITVYEIYYNYIIYFCYLSRIIQNIIIIPLSNILNIFQYKNSIYIHRVHVYECLIIL